MNSVDRYGFINAKLRARIGMMRESHLDTDMSKATTLAEAVAVMDDTGFSSVAELYRKTGDLEQMGLSLMQSEIASWREIASYLDGAPRDFVLRLLQKSETENLKNAIRLWYSSVVRMHSLRWRSEYLCRQKIVSDIDWTGIINATDWDHVLAAVNNTIFHPVLARYSMEKIREEGLFTLECELDRCRYTALMEEVQKLSRSDRDIAYPVLCTDFDLKNLLNMVRFGRYYSLDSETLEKMLFPWGKLYKSRQVAEYIAKPADQRDPEALISRFFPSALQEISLAEKGDSVRARAILAKEIHNLEALLHSEREREYRALLARDPFTIGIIMAYEFYYGRSVARVRAVLNGKYYGYSDEKIREVVG